MNYIITKLVNGKRAKQMYDDYSDYLDQKKKESKNLWYLTIATVSLLIVAYVFTLI